ncbi:3-keto-disaccharide hydrolase [Pirellulaceae bacterium SH501]
MKKLILLAAIATSGVPFLSQSHLLSQEPAKAANSAKLEEGFEWLFNGKSFDGWEGNLDWFRLEEGAIVAGSLEKKIPHNEFLCTKEKFGDFELKLEVKLRGQGDNAGVQFRTARIPNNTEVSGYQCDVGRAWNRNVWGCLYDESRRNKMLADANDENLKKWVKQDDWNELTIKAVGNRIELGLNGNPTVTYIEEDTKIAKDGVIGLQIHSGPPTEALYRNIRIKRLSGN